MFSATLWLGIAMNLADALNLKALAHVRMVAGASGLKRDVLGVHVVDFPNPVPWVRAGQILLTTGYAWPHDAVSLRTLIQDLDTCRLAAVGLAVPGFFECMPPPACEVAEELGLPLFEIPWKDSFGQVIHEVYSAILNEQYSLIKRSEEIHRGLTYAAVEATSLQDLIVTLGYQLSRAVTFEDPDGRVLAYHTIDTQEDAIRRTTLEQGRGAPEYESWLEQQGYSRLIRASVRPLQIPGSPALGIAARVVCPVRIKQELVGLVWIIEGTNPLSELDMRAAEHAAVVAALHVAHQRSLATVEARLGYSFLDSLLEGRFKRSPQAIERAHMLGFNIDGMYQIGMVVMDVVVPLSNESFLRRERLAERLRRRLREQDMLALVSVSHNQIPFLVPVSYPAETLWEMLAQPDLTMILSRPHRGADDIQRGYSEICSVLPHLAPGKFYRYEHLLVPRLLMGDETARSAFLDDLFGPLQTARNGPQLIDTLLVWAKAGFQIKRAAQDLCVHPKTISYRLVRSAELSGLAFDDPDIRFRLQLAVQLLSLTDKKYPPALSS
jgi:purine catabolism regulator